MIVATKSNLTVHFNNDIIIGNVANVTYCSLDGMRYVNHTKKIMTGIDEKR